MTEGYTFILAAFSYFAHLCLTQCLEYTNLQNLATTFDVLEVLSILANRAEEPRLTCWVAEMLVGAFQVVHTDGIAIPTIGYLSGEENQVAEASLGTKLLAQVTIKRSSFVNTFQLNLSQLQHCFDTVPEPQKRARVNSVLCNVFGAIDQLITSPKPTVGP